MKKVSSGVQRLPVGKSSVVEQPPPRLGPEAFSSTGQIKIQKSPSIFAAGAALPVAAGKIATDGSGAQRKTGRSP